MDKLKPAPNAFLIFTRSVAYLLNEPSQEQRQRASRLWHTMGPLEKQPYYTQSHEQMVAFKKAWEKLHNRKYKYSPRQPTAAGKRAYQKRVAGKAKRAATVKPLIILPPFVEVDPATADRTWPSLDADVDWCTQPRPRPSSCPASLIA